MRRRRFTGLLLAGSAASGCARRSADVPKTAAPGRAVPGACPPCASSVEGISVASAEETALGADAVDRFVAKARREGSTALVVLEDGRLVVEEYFGGSRSDRAFAMSVTKSIVALELGVLQDRGHLELDAPLSATLVPEWASTERAAITLRHLMTHTSGLDATRYGAPDRWDTGSIEAHGLGAECVAPPGTAFAYNNQAADFLAVVARRADPERLFLDDLLQRDVFGPLGVLGATWKKDGHGQPRAAGELVLRAIDLAKIGRLVLDGGTHEGHSIVSRERIDAMLAPGTALYAGCGLLWWRDGDAERALAYRADGYLGQYVIVVPHARLVAVRMRDPARTSWDESEHAWPDFVWDVLALAGTDVPEGDRNGFARRGRDRAG